MKKILAFAVLGVFVFGGNCFASEASWEWWVKINGAGYTQEGKTVTNAVEDERACKLEIAKEFPNIKYDGLDEVKAGIKVRECMEMKGYAFDKTVKSKAIDDYIAKKHEAEAAKK